MRVMAYLGPGSPLGLHRVLEPGGVLPQAAYRLDTRATLWDSEARVRVRRLNLDAASYRQLVDDHGGDQDRIRREILAIVQARGKMHNPVTGSGGMLVGTVDDVGPDHPLGLRPGDDIATLVSLTLTPLVLTDGLMRWDGGSEQIPCDGYAILFARSVVARIPADVPEDLALAVFDVCGAPALTARVVAQRHHPTVVVIGAAGKSGALSCAAARQAGAGRVLGVVPVQSEAAALADASLVDEVVVVDARDPVAVEAAVCRAGGPADVTVVCTNVSGCEHGSILATATGGTVIFFSMATSFTAAALGAEGLGADVTMLIGNGYVPGHAEFALDLLRTVPGVQRLYEAHLPSAVARHGSESP
jgi:L-erythro-3,5-diaminohexanoate dehydrogenase